MDVEMLPVESTSIAAVGYDRDTATLYVQFLESGETYAYYQVRAGVFEELLAAESKGAYFNRAIRDKFPYARL